MENRQSVSVVVVVASLLGGVGCELYFATGEGESDADVGAPDARVSHDADAAPCGNADRGLVAWWPADGDTHDLIGGHDATASGSVDFVAGIRGQAFRFEGDAFLSAEADGFPSGSADRTLALWARIDGVVAQESFFAGYGGFGTQNAAFALGATTAPGAGPAIFFSQWGEDIIGPVLAIGAWHHVAVVQQAGIAILYLDGQLVGSQAFALTTVASTFYLGKLPGAEGDIRRLVGVLDDVRLYSRALDSEEIAALARP
jgi:hypothetical protein